MRHAFLLIALLAVGLCGAVLLGSGITGLVISQSCCFGDACPAEYLCDAAEPHLESPRGLGMPLAGAALLLVALLGAVFVLRRG